jgi:hypothetical protein
MTFGFPRATGFMFWGLRSTSANSFGLVDSDWNSTPAGMRLEQLLAEWDTNLTTTISADGTIAFTGFYGDYVLTINGQQFPLTLVKGQTAYAIPGYPIPSRPAGKQRGLPVR